MRKRTTTRHRRRTRRPARDSKRWVQTVKTVSTFPPEGLFTKDADTIARVLATKRVSPKGIGSGYKMLLYFINRGGRGIPSRRRAELERAKRIMRRRMAERRH
ncbi:MAG TPA: DUF3175 domain-containing protein [Verrucomicrobiae bacterium]|jgi:hypothetical protein|nr:DUF3175 domain-containing protein [Verrucomicrobiae bacterium]